MKLTKHAWILWGAALAVVLVLALAIPFVRSGVFWIGLLCTVAMFGVCAFAFARAFRRGGTLESKLLGWPIFKVGYTMVIAQIVVGFLLMALAVLCPIWAAVMVEVLVFAFMAASLTVKDAAREAVAAAETSVINNTAGWKAIRVKADALAAASDDARLKKLAEEIRYADPAPTGMDREISAAIDSGDAGQALRLMQQRKALAKAEKR